MLEQGNVRVELHHRLLPEDISGSSVFYDNEIQANLPASLKRVTETLKIYDSI